MLCTKFFASLADETAVQDKLAVFRDRYLLQQQRIRRNRLFTAPVFGASSAQQQQKHIEVRCQS